MDSFKGPCPHQSVPVEIDERLMTSSSLNLAWPSFCKQCSGLTETSKGPQEHSDKQARGPALSAGQWRLAENQHQHEPRAARHAAPRPHFTAPTNSGHTNALHPAAVWPRGLREQVPLSQRDLLDRQSGGFVGSSNWPHGHSVEESEHLEPAHSLKSGVHYTHYDPSLPPARIPGPYPMPGSRLRQCACCPPANLPHHNNPYYWPDYPADPREEPHQSWNPPHDGPQLRNAPNNRHGSGPQCVAPPRDVMHEVSVGLSHQAGPVPATREIKKTISLSEEYRNLFITYSVDTATEIIPFTKFLTDQGFNPAIDIFDNPIRRMGITKWMDSFLNDKSVLIIVVISPKYKEDVEGDGDDEHGLHTKYIHNQIQNEYIQQGCLNFRLVPVLFPNATKRDVPNWLQSTRIYHWPWDTQDLLLRLLREERYIFPQRPADLTLTVRPL